MPKLRTPTNVLELKGSFRRHADRLKKRQYEPRELPELKACPEYLDPAIQTAWNDIASRAYWLRQPDEVALERAAVLLAELRSGRFDSNKERLFQNYIRMLGLPATERSKVVAPPKKTVNKYSDLA